MTDAKAASVVCIDRSRRLIPARVYMHICALHPTFQTQNSGTCDKIRPTLLHFRPNSKLMRSSHLSASVGSASGSLPGQVKPSNGMQVSSSATLQPHLDFGHVKDNDNSGHTIHLNFGARSRSLLWHTVDNEKEKGEEKYQDDKRKTPLTDSSGCFPRRNRRRF